MTVMVIENLLYLRVVRQGIEADSPYEEEVEQYGFSRDDLQRAVFDRQGYRE